MRNILGHILLCLVLMLCFRPMAAAVPQDDNYDKALDKYSRICDRCVELRTSVESGQGVGIAELKTLLAELSSLRETLSNASGKMSESQTERFEAIKAKYLHGMNAFGKKPGRPTFVPVPKIAPVTELVEVTSLIPCPMSLRQAQRPELPEVESGRLNATQQYPYSKASISKPFRLAILADVGMFPTPSYGAMAVATWNGIGAYVNYRSDFRKNEYSYVCASAGGTDYGRIWATGDSRESRTVATAGFSMFPSRHLGFCAGAGLTSYRLCWEDVSGEWAKVKDKSFSKLAVDAGVLLNIKSLILSLGVSSDFLGHADARFGIGVRF